MNQFHETAVERRVMTPDAVAFLVDLEREFGWRRGRILDAREARQRRISAGEMPDFLPETRETRESEWVVAPVPSALEDRRVEITGPVERKMMINGLNSGARVYMADFEDATTPTWDNLMNGHVNLVDAYRREIRLDTGDRTYRLGDAPATLMVRPRGWHLEEKHFLVDGVPMSASLFDFGLYMFHGGREAIATGSGPFLYLPKLESHEEARLWNDVFVWTQERLDIPQGTIKATVLIETILAAFEMDEILYELRDHSAGLNAGRWDYIFSLIKKFHAHPEFVLPDRGQVTMTVPFMRSYCDLLVSTCHRRAAHAMGGMSAFIPNRRDTAVTERALEAVRADKSREAGAGFDGTWVAHPDLVPVAMAEFDRVLGDRPHQIDRRRDDVSVTAADLLDLDFPGSVTLDGVRSNVSVGIRYLSAWLGGTGAVALDNLMEDAATAEISRSQIWQWQRHGVTTDDGQVVDEALVRRLAAEVVETEERGPFAERIEEARKVFEDVALSDHFTDFLTPTAYELIN